MEPEKNSTRKARVYDLPTRIFHWVFALCFIAAFSIGVGIDDDSPVFIYHMICGVLLIILTVLRIVWGITGSRYARFSSFALNPVDLTGYFKSMLTGLKKRYAGHNPASSWAALVMIALALATAGTGILMSRGNYELYEEIHEVLAFTFLFTVIAHVSGVILHMIRHRDNIAASMVTGQKLLEANSSEMQPVKKHGIIAIVFLFIIGTSATMLISESGSGQIKLFGYTIASVEHEENKDHDDEYEHHDYDEDDDD